jgi:16S rRNA processing protein RimM
MMETGANGVLVVQGERERLIPFIADVIAAVDLEAGVMRVNWDADY